MNVFLRSSEHRGVLVIEMSGALTVLDRTFQRTILDLLEAGHCHFILKMSDVPYVDSGGLGQLISIHTAIGKRNGTMQLLAPSKRLRERLRFTQLDTVFDIVEDEAAA